MREAGDLACNVINRSKPIVTATQRPASGVLPHAAEGLAGHVQKRSSHSTRSISA